MAQIRSAVVELILLVLLIGGALRIVRRAVRVRVGVVFVIELATGEAGAAAHVRHAEIAVRQTGKVAAAEHKQRGAKHEARAHCDNVPACSILSMSSWIESRTASTGFEDGGAENCGGEYAVVPGAESLYAP